MTAIPFPGYPGFQFEVSRTELVTHLKTRAQAHASRATELEEKANQIRDSRTISEEDMKLLERRTQFSNAGPYGGMGNMNPLGGGDQRSRMIQAVISMFVAKAKNNRLRANELSFYAAHVPAGPNFLLTRSELEAFEFFGSFEWAPFSPMSQMPALPDDEMADGLDGLG